MYELGGAFSEDVVAPGTNLLVAGAPMTGKRALALDVLARGSADGEGALVVTTKDSAERVLADFRSLPEVTADARVGVVDCVSRQQGVRTASDDEFVRFASSPNDLTGIGIELSELLQTFYRDDNRRNRVLLHSLSTLLMYADLQTVFRFLHVFTGRVQSVEALGLFVIDSTAHDAQTLSTIKQLFDGVVEVETTDDARRARLLGVPDVDGDWRTF
ncbi:RAD55 family ATPase [Halobacteriaceae archaeon GCM10025711]